MSRIGRRPIPLPDGVEGKSLMPVIAGEKERHRETIFGAYRDVQRSVRTERWKLIRYPHINKHQLFDLQTDPEERKDLAGEAGQADRVKEMTAVLKKLQADLGDRQPLSTDKPAPLQIELPKDR